MKMFVVSREKSKFSSFISDVITDVDKQNRNSMSSTLSAYLKEKNTNISANQNNFDTRMFLTF